MSKINKDDKAMVKAYVKWCLAKDYTPTEYDISNFMNSWDGEQRLAVEEYINKLVDQATQNRL